MIKLKNIILDALVSNIKISDAILIAADNAVKVNGKGSKEVVSNSKQTEVSK